MTSVHRRRPRSPGVAVIGQGDVGELRFPPLAKGIVVLDMTGLGRSGGEGGHLGGTLGAEALVLEGRLDLDPALGERPQDVFGMSDSSPRLLRPTVHDTPRGASSARSADWYMAVAAFCHR